MITHTLQIDVDDLDPATIEAIRVAVSTVLADASDVKPAPSAVLGWTPELAKELDKRLRARNRPVQADIIKAIAQAGGSIDRPEVYDIGDYKPERSLNGSTKPVKGVMADMVAEGLLPADAAKPMIPIYDAAVPSYQKAKGFYMAPELAPVFHQALAE